MNDELRAEFEKAAEYLRQLPSDIKMTDDQKLRSYGLYKQVEVGDVNTDRPGIFSPVNRAKWDAWKECEGQDAATAAQSYIELVNEINPNWRG